MIFLQNMAIVPGEDSIPSRISGLSAFVYANRELVRPSTQSQTTIIHLLNLKLLTAHPIGGDGLTPA